MLNKVVISIAYHFVTGCYIHIINASKQKDIWQTINSVHENVIRRNVPLSLKFECK